MDSVDEQRTRDDLREWVRRSIDDVVDDMMQKQTFDNPLLEARPDWMLPYHVVVGRIREQGATSEFLWFICGEVPTDYLHASAAGTPREAARHFSLKWQMDADRQDKSDREELLAKAEALYDLTRDADLWNKKSGF